MIGPWDEMRRDNLISTHSFSRRNLLGTIGSQTSPELIGQRLPELLFRFGLFTFFFQRFEISGSRGFREAL